MTRSYAYHPDHSAVFKTVWPHHELPSSLADDEVHVWCAAVEATAASLVSLHHILSGDERSRATRFYFQRDRERYIVGHALLRLLLAHYLASSPEQIRFEDGSHGKPALAPPYKQSGLRFNLSHSGDRVVVGITRGRELGVDVEYMDRRRASLDLASRFFAPPEVENLQALPTEMQLAGFFNCWTRKEAFIKGTGKGLAQGLDTFAVSLTPGESARLLWVKDDPVEAARWSLAALDLFALGPGYAGAVAAEGNDWRLRTESLWAS